MKLYYLIVCGLVCTLILSTGCNTPPPPPPPPEVGDLEAREITYSPNPVIIRKDNSVHLKVANVGDDAVKGYVKFTIVCPSVNYIVNDRWNVQVLKGAIVTETFRGWHPIYPGDYQITCLASAIKDTNPSNNSKSLSVRVNPPPPPPPPPPPSPPITVPINPDQILPPGGGNPGGNPQGGLPPGPIGGGPSIGGIITL